MTKSKDIDIEEFTEQTECLAWYTLRILSINEDKVISSMHEKIKYYGLEEKILDIQVFVEHLVEESKDFLPNSPELPMRVVKNTEKSTWVKTPYGTFKKIKLVEKRPFKGLVFIKLFFSNDLVKVIKSWDKTIYFLGDPYPQAMTESAFLKMKSSIKTEIPNLQEYIKENHYQEVKGVLRNIEITPAQEQERKEILRKMEEKKAKEEQSSKTFTVEDEVKPEKTSTSTNNNVFEVPVNIGKPIQDIKKLKVNDYVFVSDFGAQGQIQNIDLDTGEVVVSIQAFGRSQPITCDISKLREI